jgi:ABC-type Fe3+/spermidine/putrescine transport system ATPase subunit
MPQINLDNITKSFDNGKVIALNQINLKIEHGSYVFILGPSGCGKTTLLKIISGLLVPTNGRVLIGDRDVTELPPQERGIAFVFQSFEIFPMTVWENCTYALNVQGYDERYIIRQGERALKVVGLLDRADEIPTGWGNGDLQRLGIARAICSGAKILIMDEPLGSLDPKISAEFRWELRNIIKDTRLTAIQVTHNQEEAMNVGDHIIIMRDGRILQEDSPEILYNHPNSIFVGNFLGSLNILEGYIRESLGNDKYIVKTRLGGPSFPVSSQRDRFHLDENVIIAVRCEDVFLFKKNYDYEKSEADWEDICLAKAVVIENFLTGKEKGFVIELDNGETLRVMKPEVFQYDFEIGEEIDCGVFEEEILLYKYPANLLKEMDLQ